MGLVLLVLVCLVGLPSAASAGTVNADVREGPEGTALGRVTFAAAPGESNRLTISTDSRGTVFSDAAYVVHARGDCRQLSAHTARCPFTEGGVFAKLRDGDDTADVKTAFVVVTGGTGDDVLRGSPGLDFVAGEAGNDVLLGGRDDDQLTGGPGRDRLVGGPGDDVLVDGETDAQAARDVLSGGRSANGPGDTVSYAKRHRPLRIDLRRGKTSTEDRLRGFESVTGGHGDDRLAGDRDDNWLAGGPGDDVLHGRDGHDIPSGGTGNDHAYGDGGDDVVWGDEGLDGLFGGEGDDFVISREERGGPAVDDLECGNGSDTVRSDSTDTLTGGCESLATFSNGLHLGTQPTIDADSADFSFRCSGGPQCSGTITLTGIDDQQFGMTHFAVPGDAKVVGVVVPLSSAGTAALEQGTTVQVDLRSDDPNLEEPGGYRLFMRAQ